MFGDDWGQPVTTASAPSTAVAPSLPLESDAAPASRTAEEGQRALYLRWRPQRFEDVVGQDHVTRTLRNAVVRDRLAHAYLFTGPRGTGKTSVARILYRAANCPNALARDGDPCNECPVCVNAMNGRAMDLVEIDAASNRGIDDIRDLRDKVAYRPSDGRYRVYIIDEAHELTPQAWDAFLKTLEEPPAHAIFVMATTEAHKIPATIVSRSQRFDFRRIPFEATRDQLARVARSEGLTVGADVLDRLARTARGGLRDALSLLDQLGAFGGDTVDMGVARAVLGLPPLEAVRDVLDALTRHDSAHLMQQLLDLGQGGADMRQFVEELLVHLRALLVIRAGAPRALSSEFSADELEWLQAQASSWPMAVLTTVIQEVSTALARIRDAQQFQVQVELALLAACGAELGQAARERGRAAPTTRASDAAPRNLPSASPTLSRPAPSIVVPPAAASSERTATAPHPPAADHRPVSGGSAPVSGPGEASANPHPAGASTASDDVAGARSAVRTMDHDSRSAILSLGPDSAVPSTSTADVDFVRGRWTDVVEQVSARKPLIGTLFSTARPLSLDDGLLTIAFRTRFDCQRTEKNRASVEDALQVALGARVRLKCTVVSADGDGPSLFDDPVLSHAAKLFGGEPRRIG